jgi:predicted NUDIX family NTP pyrophosphohydrolase
MTEVEVGVVQLKLGIQVLQVLLVHWGQPLSFGKDRKQLLQQ